MTLGIITGLQSEADIARTIPGAIVLCFGPGPIKGAQAAEQLVKQGATSLMSFGIAGGLDPALKPGALIAAPTDLALRLTAAAETIATVTDPVLTPQDKAALFRTSGASAVDMESSAVRDVAQAHGLPFQMIRTICDTAEDAIPESALHGVSAEGHTRPVRVAAGLLTRPQDMAALITLGKRQKAALDGLRQAAAKIQRAE